MTRVIRARNAVWAPIMAAVVETIGRGTPIHLATIRVSGKTRAAKDSLRSRRGCPLRTKSVFGKASGNSAPERRVA